MSESPLPSTPTPRHFKRLSLSVGSSGGGSIYNSPLSTPIRTPGSISTGGGGGSGGNRPLRLSLSGNNNNSNVKGSIPISAPPDSGSNSFRDSPTTISGSNWNYPEESLNLVAGGSTSPITSTSTLPTSSTRPIRQSRRTSSISYSSSGPRDSNSLPSSPFTSTSLQNQSLSPISSSSTLLPITRESPSSSPRVSPTLTGRSLLNSRGGDNNGSSNNNGVSRGGYISSNTPPATPKTAIGLDNLREEEEEEEEERNKEAGKTGGETLARTSSGSGNPSTMIELNSDLLSFIAKKERKCLDLREELKRHEKELKNLKKKWEIIVAKSVAAATAPPPSSSSTSTSPNKSNSNRSLFPRTSTSSSSSATSATSNNLIPRSPQHALDLSLLSSTFDHHSSTSKNEQDNAGGYGTADLESELVENVQAAKAWMGGVFGKVLEAVGGTEMVAPTNNGLEGVAEEDEEEEEDTNQGRNSSTPQKKIAPSHKSSETSVSSLDDWQPSRTSTNSLTSQESSSSFFGQFYSSTPATSTTSNSNSGRRTSESALNDSTSSQSRLSEDSETPYIQSQSPPLFPLPLPSSATSTTISPPPPTLLHSFSRPPPTIPRVEGGHNRRRSTFDILGSAAGGSWNALGKKWTAVSSSEMVKNGRAVAIGAVEGFERRLTETLGPLEGPSPSSSTNTTPISSPATTINSALPSLPLGAAGVGVFSSWKTSSPQSAARRESSESNNSNRGSKKEGEWDWTSFLESGNGGGGSNSNPSTPAGNNNNNNNMIGSNSTTPTTSIGRKSSLSKSTGYNNYNTSSINSNSTLNKKPTVLNLFDDLTSSSNNNSPTSNQFLPDPISPTLSPPPPKKIPLCSPTKLTGSSTTVTATRRSNSNPHLAAVANGQSGNSSTSSNKIEEGEKESEGDDWGKW